MVLIKDDNRPSFEWSLGRIKNIIRGQDGLVRVADVQTAKNILRRPIHKLAPLPVQQEDSYSNTEDDNNRDKPSTSAAPTRKRKSSSNIAALLLTCLFVPLVTSVTVQQYPFKGDPGIYFERIGMANIISSTWNLVNYFELKPFWKEAQLSHHYANVLVTTCEALQESSCQRTINQLRQQLSMIDATNQLLTHKHRSRRGAFNFVGNVANGLFGLLDSEYADKLTRSIENIQQNEETLKEHIQNQTSYLDRTLSIMKKNQLETEREFNIIEKIMHRTTNEVNNLTQQMKVQKLSIIFNELALQAFMQISHFRTIQEALVNILTDAHHEQINPELLTPKELQDELSTITHHASLNMKLPLPINDITQYYSLMSINHRITEDYIIFNIQIPLVSPIQFELLKLTAIPWYKNDTFYKVELSTSYVIIDLLRDHYYALSHPELEQCLTVDKTSFFCPQLQPLLNSKATTGRCAIDILKESDTIADCRSVIIGNGPHWFPLQESNAWIFSVGQMSALNVICNNTLSTLKIYGSEILRIGEDCIIRTQQMTISGHKTISKCRQLSYVPTIRSHSHSTSQLIFRCPTKIIKGILTH